MSDHAQTLREQIDSYLTVAATGYIKVDPRAELLLRQAADRLASLEQQEARRDDVIGACVKCCTRIFRRDGMIDDERGQLHPICGVVMRAEVAEAQLASLARPASDNQIAAIVNAVFRELGAQDEDDTARELMAAAIRPVLASLAQEQRARAEKP